MAFTKYFTILFLFFVLSGNGQSPPDSPLKPQEWIDKMGIGSWWIFNIPPAPNTNITISYSSAILDSLQNKFCINGGRLHWVIESPKYSSYDANGELPQQYIDYIAAIIDDFMVRDMAISLNIQFLSPGTEMTEANKTKMKNAWAKVSDEFKDVSHNLAMCPVIEFHGWQNYDKKARQDSLNKLYHDLTYIFREKNPTRIMSYKPWGAAKRGEAYTLDFPFGDDPSPQDTQQFYYVASFSGSAGLGDWGKWYPDMPQSELEKLYFQTMNGGSDDTTNVWGMNAMIKFRDDTGIPFWCDHWRPNYHKKANTPEQWTMEQNLAYVEFFENKLREIGSAGAGLQTRTFWNDDTDDLIRLNSNSTDSDIMSVKFMNLLEDMCHTTSDVSGLNKKSTLIKLYPNPANDFLHLEKENIYQEKFDIYNILGESLKPIIDVYYDGVDNATIDLRNIIKGIYFIKSKNSIIKFLKI